MSVTETNAASSAAPIELPNRIVESESAGEDSDWVIVKKRKITILIPPAPPSDSHSKSPEMNSIPTRSNKAVKSSSLALKKRRRKRLKSKLENPAVTPSGDCIRAEEVSLKPQESHQLHATSVGNGTQVDGSDHVISKPILELENPGVAPSADCIRAQEVSLKAQESHHIHATSVRNGTQVDESDQIIAKPTLELPVLHVRGDGNVAMQSKRIFGASEAFKGYRNPPVGSFSIVNRRLRAMNLGRKLQGVGGLRSWLLSQGFQKFEKVFEKEELSKYQLANLTMRELKGMGTDAVGPRRKLINAIDRLCQPYFMESMESDA